MSESPDCPLPKAPDAVALDRLCMTLIESAWYDKPVGGSPPTTPRSVGNRRPYFLMGDLHGPKV